MELVLYLSCPVLGKYDVHTRILKVIAHFGKNQNSFSVSLGVDAARTAKILQGKNKPSYEYLALVLEKYPQVNARWLLLGEGKMF